MGGRFGKYGDNKRITALRRGRREKSRLERVAGRMLRSRARSPHRDLNAERTAASASKTYKSAVVIIPSDEIQDPIQELRRSHDRHHRRWMPHITLIYPFRPAREFETLTPLLAEACRNVAPFDIQLARFGCFHRGRKIAVLYLIPEPAPSLRALQAAIQSVVPDCDDVSRFPGGYTPHLSVGQVPGHQARALRAALQSAWRPLTFTVARACLIWRNHPPDDVFRVGPVLPLGG